MLNLGRVDFNNLKITSIEFSWHFQNTERYSETHLRKGGLSVKEDIFLDVLEFRDTKNTSKKKQIFEELLIYLGENNLFFQTSSSSLLWAPAELMKMSTTPKVETSPHLFAHPDMEKPKFTTRKTTTQNSKISQQPPPKSIARKAAPNDQRSVTDGKESQQISPQWWVERGWLFTIFPDARQIPKCSSRILLFSELPRIEKTETTPPSTFNEPPNAHPHPSHPNPPTNLGSFLFQKLQLGVDRVLFGL